MEDVTCCAPFQQIVLLLRRHFHGGTKSIDSPSCFYECYDTDPLVSEPLGHGSNFECLTSPSKEALNRKRNWLAKFCSRRRSHVNDIVQKTPPKARGVLMQTPEKPRPRPRRLSEEPPPMDISCPTMDALSAKKRAVVAELQQRVEALPSSQQPPRRHELWLKRFAAHGKWNTDKALKLYLEMEAWRREVGADDILKQEIRKNRVIGVDTIAFYPYSHDCLGRVIYWMRVGHAPWWRPLFERCDEGLVAQTWISEHYLNEVAEKAEETGVWRERAVVLVDLSDLDLNYFQGLAGSSRARARGKAMTTAQYYPGLMDKAYILHAPGFAGKAWTILKAFLSRELMEKAVMVTNADEVRSMLTDLGPDNVPQHFGGTSIKASFPLPDYLTMPAEGWSDTIKAWRPRDIRIAKGERHVETISVPAGGRVRWQFALWEHSILFEISASHSGGDFTLVRPQEEVCFSGIAEPLYGETLAPVGGGDIRFTWDNSMSKWLAKTLLLRTEIV